ncbi:MAG: SDR family NAD(P)-dependent oxidoreductase, partial [Pseudooceanicola atlanticus]
MLEGKAVVVTGAGRGIGRDIALMMASKGAKVVVNDLGGAADGAGADASPAEEVVSEIKAAGGEAVANFGNVAKIEDANAMYEQSMDEFGTIDVIVNNAGILRDVIFHKMTEAEWDSVIDVHLKGSFNMAQAVAKQFKMQASGCFINFTSTSGLIGNFGQANYSAAKM